MSIVQWLIQKTYLRGPAEASTKNCYLFAKMANNGSSRGILGTIDNVETRRSEPCKKPDVLSRYSWHSLDAEKSLSERKSKTERRREELLVLLYREDLTTDQVEDLIQEWISLVTERNRLLHEEIDKENSIERERYVQDLRRLLRDRPVLAGGREEIDLRDALLTLEREVSEYCRSHNISSPLRSQPEFREEVHIMDNPQKDQPVCTVKSSQRHNILDQETGQTNVLGLNHSSFECSTPRQNSINEEWDGPCKAVGVTRSNFLQVQGHGDQLQEVPVVIRQAQPHDITPTLTPQPPTPPPLPINPNPCLLGGAIGTVQFSGTRSTELTNTSSTCKAAGSHCGEPYSRSRVEAPDPSFEEFPSNHERKNLLDEISSVGRSVLRRTPRARSPGGTPIKATKNRLTLTGNTDMLQRALISKFRSLHSTPIQSGRGGNQGEQLDFSNTWSDINNSVAFDDPDLTTTSNSGFITNDSGSVAGNFGYCRLGDKRSPMCTPNTSTAV